MLNSIFKSLQSPSRRRRQAGRSVPVPAQTLELKQLLSGVQPTVDSPELQAEATSDTTAGAAVVVTASVGSASNWNAAMFSREPTVLPTTVNNAWGTRPTQPVVTAQPRVATSVQSSSVPVFSSGTFSRSVTQVSSMGAMNAQSVRPIQPITAQFAHPIFGAPIGGDDHGNNAATATTVTSPSTTEGQLHRGDVDWFRLNVKQGQTYTISVDLITLADSTLRIRNAESTTLKFDDNGGFGRGSKLPWTATEDSTLFIEVKARSWSQTGSYQLQISNESVEADQTEQTTSTTTSSTTIVRRTTWISFRRIIWFR